MISLHMGYLCIRLDHNTPLIFRLNNEGSPPQVQILNAFFCKLDVYEKKSLVSSQSILTSKVIYPLSGV